jgi:hypothetical protein
VGKTKEVVQKELNTWKDANASFFPKITDAAMTTTLAIKDPGYGVVKFVYTYNKDKICNNEKTIAINDSARRNYLNSVLEQRGYEWKKLNGNQYISKFSDKLMIELPGDPRNFSFTVYRVDWTKETYDMLNKN